MALETRRDFYGTTTNIKTERLDAMSRMISTVTGLKAWPNEATIRQDAFAQGEGIRQHKMLREPSIDEIMCPEEVGVPETDLILGKHSDRHARDHDGHRLDPPSRRGPDRRRRDRRRPVDAIFQAVEGSPGSRPISASSPSAASPPARTPGARSRSNSRALTGPSAAAPDRPTSSRPRLRRRSTPSTPSLRAASGASHAR
jgi:hypothetical protein